MLLLLQPILAYYYFLGAYIKSLGFARMSLSAVTKIDAEQNSTSNQIIIVERVHVVLNLIIML